MTDFEAQLYHLMKVKDTRQNFLILPDCLPLHVSKINSTLQQNNVCLYFLNPYLFVYYQSVHNMI